MTVEARRVEVRLVAEDEVPLVAKILEEAAAWSAATERRAWSMGLFATPGGEGWVRIQGDVTNRTAYLIWLDGVSAGTFALRFRDVEFWPEAADDALYLHRFAVRRAAAGVGRLAIPWMIDEARRQHRAYLRLDCWADNPSIRRYYESAGFSLHSETTIEGLRFCLYEMRVAS